MKIEKINDNKIRVTLSTRELEERNLNFQSLRYNTPEAQTLFWDMMKQAENEHGFKTTNCQLFIEAASLNNDQFVVTVTKLQDKVLPPSTQKKKAPALELKVRKKSQTESENTIYKFNDFEQICSLISNLDIKKDLPSSLYEYNGSYFLIMRSSKKVHLLALEFGEIVKDSISIEGFLKEHGNKIIEKNAINKISENFNLAKK